MPRAGQYRSPDSRRNAVIDGRARRAAFRDIAEMYPDQYAVLLDGYRREMRREEFGDPEFTATHDRTYVNGTRDTTGRYAKPTKDVQ